ncbi:AMP-binding protein [Sphaerothrix gracilis]|uniref:AMP-binding protein n=1 Tax=Sphaerothrix gracilis TaxID=3151835 RepID=UPI0031FD2574
MYFQDLSPRHLSEGPPASTIDDLVRSRSERSPESIAFTFLADGEQESERLTYSVLDQRSRAIAAQLQSQFALGTRALLLYPPGLDFITAFLGCLYAGVVAVPAYPPKSKRQQKMARLQSIVADSQAAIALTTTELLADIQACLQAAGLGNLTCIDTNAIAAQLASDWHAPDSTADTLAFLQYTSGSTGDPKGVMVSHGNIMHNLSYIHQASKLTSDSVSVSWLPSFHDMGLIDGILQPLYSGYRGILMPSVAFIQQPIRWLQAISDYRATHCGGPNFGYDLCVHKTTPEQRAALDLSCWTQAYVGAEPIRKQTLAAFIQTFTPYGFQSRFFYPCYGMAESTLMISGGAVSQEPAYCTVQAEALEQHQVIEVPPLDPSGRDVVGCGQAQLETQIAIVHADTRRRCQPHQVGEVWVASPSIAQGYWGRPAETAATFGAYIAPTQEGPFLRTGDLGFMRAGELFITGRLKDLIVVRGRNHYPQDLELTAEQSHPALRPSCGAAFGIEVGGEERVVLVQEVERSHLRYLDADAVISQMRQAIAREHDLEVYGIALLKPASILKTSSGKIQRRACRASYLAGALAVVASHTLADADGRSRPPLATAFVAPRNQTEHTITALWQDLLKLDRVGVYDSFFELGGDSLLAAQLSEVLSARFQRDFSAIDPFEYPTIEALARYLDAAPNQSAKFSQIRSRARQQQGAIAAEKRASIQRRQNRHG